MQLNPFSSLSRYKKRALLAKEIPSSIISNRYQEQPSQAQQQSLNQHLSSLNKAETQLEREIYNINLALHKMQKRMAHSNGILFQIGVDYHLANALRELIQQGVSVNCWGFSFEEHAKIGKTHRKAIGLPVIAQSGNLRPLAHSYNSSEEKFSFERYYQPTPPLLDKWKYFSKGATPKYYKQRKRFKTEQQNRSEMNSPNNLVVSFNSLLGTESRAADWSSMPISKSLVNHRPNFSSIKSPRKQKIQKNREQYLHFDLSPPQIFEMLERQTRLISIWLPPSNDPELLGVMSVLVRQKEDSTNLCLIKKYWWMKKALSRRLFNCILDWLGNQHGFTDELTLLTTKPLLDQLFAPLGWKLTNWIREDKLRITYKRTLL